MKGKPRRAVVLNHERLRSQLRMLAVAVTAIGVLVITVAMAPWRPVAAQSRGAAEDVLPIVATQSLAQTAPESFEVVSIKPRVSEATIRGGGNAPDRFERPDADLMLLIRYAYDLFQFQVAGVPDWISSKRWDVSAKAGGPVRGAAAMRPLVRRMLEDRFALKAHMETRELPIYELVLARRDGRLGTQIKRAAVDCMPFLNGLRPMQESPRDADGLPLCQAGASLSGGLLTPRLNGQPLATGLVPRVEAALQRRVIDKTDLTGNYDIELTYVDEALFQKGVGTEDGPALSTALQEQLGMKLEPSRGAVQVLVIDAVSEPTVN